MQEVIGSTPISSTKESGLIRTFFMNQFYVYIIYSPLLDKYYIGYTSDLEKRLTEHNAGISLFTSKADDWELKYSEIFSNRESAIQREKAIKGKKSRKYIEWLIAQVG
jgi:putative endonuclease